MESLVIMGVAGCGKSSLGMALAVALGLPLIEGDDFHAEASKAKMRAGVALIDADRGDWLDTLAAQLAARPQGAVLTCSALRKAYRERLRATSPGLRFVFLEIDREESLRRVAARAGSHLFPTSQVDSQFATLEPPQGEPGVLAVDATLPLAQLVAQVEGWIGKGTA
jgi:gluconokinase